jgi:hypothetical protein
MVLEFYYLSEFVREDDAPKLNIFIILELEIWLRKRNFISLFFILNKLIKKIHLK